MQPRAMLFARNVADTACKALLWPHAEQYSAHLSSLHQSRGRRRENSKPTCDLSLLTVIEPQDVGMPFAEALDDEVIARR